MTRTAATRSVEGLGQLLGGGPSAPPMPSSSALFAARSTRRRKVPARAARWRTPPPGGRRPRRAIGPWYVLQRRNPAAPGMRFETLLSFVRKGRVKPQSVVRGPTTHQLWRFASHVKGLSREFGLCYSCGGSISPQAQVCPQCNRLQDPPPAADSFLEVPVGEQPASAAAAAAAPTSVATPLFREIPRRRLHRRK